MKQISKWILLFILCFCTIFSFQAQPVNALGSNFGLQRDQSKPDQNGNFSGSINIYEEKDDNGNGTGKVTVATVDTQKKTLAQWWNTVLGPYQVAVLALVGVATMTMILVFVKLCLRLAACESHPLLRERTIRGMLLSGIACALLGSLTIYLSIISNIFS